MADGFEIRSHQFMATTIYVLAADEPDRSDFLEKLGSSKKTADRAKLIMRTMEKIGERGIARCIGKSNFISILDGELGMAEVRVKGQVIRVMCYVPPARDAVVLLFDFDGHQGKTGAIPKPVMKKGRKLAAIAGECWKAEEVHHGD